MTKNAFGALTYILFTGRVVENSGTLKVFGHQKHLSFQ